MSQHNKKKDTSDTPPDKSQENYPGPRETEKAPDFVKDWEKEPPKKMP